MAATYLRSWTNDKAKEEKGKAVHVTRNMISLEKRDRYRKWLEQDPLLGPILQLLTNIVMLRGQERVTLVH